jgi:hypothetical protein
MQIVEVFHADVGHAKFEDTRRASVSFSFLFLFAFLHALAPFT